MNIKVLYLALGCLLLATIGASIWVVSPELFRDDERQQTKEELARAGLYPVPNKDVKTDRIGGGEPEPAIEETEIGPVSQFLETVRLYPESDMWGRTRAQAERAVALRPEKPSRMLLNDMQLASIKSRLRLNLKQQKYWPKLEASMRGAMRQLYDYQKRGSKNGEEFDMTSPEVQRLLVYSKEFLAMLRPDQKNEIVALARIAGMQSLLAELTTIPEAAKRAE